MWRQSKRTTTTKQNADRILAARCFYKILSKAQRHFAVFMSKQLTGISVNMLRWLVGLFFLGGFSISIYFISQAFTESIQTPIYISHLHSIPPANSRLINSNRRIGVISNDAYKKIVQFHTYMDSLQKNDRHLYDSILSSRPGLLDSVTLLELLYSQQKNTNHEKD